MIIYDHSEFIFNVRKCTTFLSKKQLPCADMLREEEGYA